MTFYLKPPRGVITLDKFETSVQQRLNFYNSDKETLDIDTYDCLVEDSGLDRTSHFMLRLYASSKPSFFNIFIQNEQKLLQLRLNSYDPQDTKRFLRRVLKQCHDVLNNNVSENLEQFCLFLRGILLEMLNPFFLRNVFNEKLHSDIFFVGK